MTSVCPYQSWCACISMREGTEDYTPWDRRVEATLCRASDRRKRPNGILTKGFTPKGGTASDGHLGSSTDLASCACAARPAAPEHRPTFHFEIGLTSMSHTFRLKIGFRGHHCPRKGGDSDVQIRQSSARPQRCRIDSVCCSVPGDQRQCAAPRRSGRRRIWRGRPLGANDPGPPQIRSAPLVHSAPSPTVRPLSSIRGVPGIGDPQASPASAFFGRTVTSGRGSLDTTRV
jgi:hypothetical protein